jgi:hypothetical protein
VELDEEVSLDVLVVVDEVVAALVVELDVDSVEDDASDLSSCQRLDAPDELIPDTDILNSWIGSAPPSGAGARAGAAAKRVPRSRRPNAVLQRLGGAPLRRDGHYVGEGSPRR